MAAIDAKDANNLSGPISRLTAGSSDWVKLGREEYSIWLSSSSWTPSKTAALIFSLRPDDIHAGPLEYDKVPYTRTSNGGLILSGPGYLRFELTNPNGTVVEMDVQQSK